MEVKEKTDVHLTPSTDLGPSVYTETNFKVKEEIQEKATSNDWKIWEKMKGVYTRMREGKPKREKESIVE